MDAASLTSFWHSSSPSFQITHCLLRSVDLFTWSMWSAATLASVWSSVGSTDGLALWLLYAAAMGETLAGLLSREASPSSILAWEEVSTGRGGASDLWDGDMTASAVVAFPMAECSDSQLDWSAITWVNRSLTSVAMLILGFKGLVLDEVAARDSVCSA